MIPPAESMRPYDESVAAGSCAPARATPARPPPTSSTSTRSPPANTAAMATTAKRPAHRHQLAALVMRPRL